jgi:hypothetical protein
MFLTVHSAAGIAIAQYTGNPLLAFSLGFISHFILDMIPHGDQELADNNQDAFAISAKTKKLLFFMGVTDGLIAVGLTVTLIALGLVANPLVAICAVAGAMAPDAINALSIFFDPKWLRPYRAVHHKLHFILNGFTISFKNGLVVQAVFLIGLLSFIYLTN